MLPPPQVLTVAFCLCQAVTMTDFIAPNEILAGINYADTPFYPPELKDTVNYRLKFEYLAPEMAPVISELGGAPNVMPDRTYQDALDAGMQYDIIWVPAGPIPDQHTYEEKTPQIAADFIAAQAPGAKYVMSVCEGSAVLAKSGVLDGRRATTNKWLYRIIEDLFPTVNWVAKARWVVDGKFWTSSGVSAGSDMAMAFVEHLVGHDNAQFVRGMIEVIEHDQDDDPFAEFHHLV
ncbi:class I glutamine amidotransferase-like protein [Cylindrobasidium torrendii FP15055 ss-10]|uniref:Class I glutamine amidotransferase-like protein n=1 Tax=Cylindrobasidium torrendii FP15055 ss-10 TaxID=1314674 RepID=A0A0D7BC41_9AGAR|nr:class I glutamine amidotransferase-like protein [Cylindrobasidium torrendii FP15055 ss-10]